MKHQLYWILPAAFFATAIGSAYAVVATENDALDIAAAKISMTRAVTIAEQQVGGKAVRAEYEYHKGQRVFDIEVVRGKEVMDVKVDAVSGNVISAVADKSDRDDGHDRAD